MLPWTFRFKLVENHSVRIFHSTPFFLFSLLHQIALKCSKPQAAKAARFDARLGLILSRRLQLRAI